MRKAVCWLITTGILLLAQGAAQGAWADGFRSISPSAAGFDAERLARLPALLERYVAEERIPGAALLVLKDGREVLLSTAGHADREAERPMTPDTIFRIASQTKAVVSVAVMILQEEGHFLISDPVGNYLPEFAETTVAVASESGAYDVVAAERQITIRDLLLHTAGIGYGYGPAADAWAEAGIQGWYFAHRDEPVRETIRRMAALPMDAQPGSAFVYGYNTDILGALVEVVSGRTLAEFLAERLFEPLEMNNTHFYLPQEKRDRLAVVYSLDENGQLARTPDVSAMVGQGAYVDGPRRSFSGGAGLLSTVSDYGRFLQMLGNGGVLDGNRILSPNTVRLMTADHLNGIDFRAGQGFGLGFAITLDLGARGVPASVGEYAWGGAYHTVYFVDPVEEVVFVYMTQVLPATGLDDVGKLRALLYAALTD